MSASSDNPPSAYGLSYPPGFLESLPIILSRPSPHTPIYGLTAEQHTQMQREYSLIDLDDSVLFPFLHGLEGDNLAQNLFFSHGRARDGRPIQAKVPRYRGLMSVVVPSEDEQPTSRNGSDDLEFDEDLDELLYDNGTHTMHNGSNQSNEVQSDEWHQGRHHSSSISSNASSFAPLSASSTATSLPSPSPSNASLSCTTTHDNPNTPPPPLQENRLSHLLTSTFSPYEILSPVTANFVDPRIPDGISLRNFGIQVATYATLSDIVLYSPKGPTRAVFEIAEGMKKAMEAKLLERLGEKPVEKSGPGEFSGGFLAYNVFVVVDSFDVYEKNFPDLVAVDSHGRYLTKTDFFAREKEEMRQLTKASKLSDNIWLGNTADVPVGCFQPSPTDGHPDPFEPSGNPDGYDICIECRDDAYFPTPGHLRHAEEHIARLESNWADHVVSVTDRRPSSPLSREGSNPPLSPTLLGLSNLHVGTPPPSSILREKTTVRSRSASPPATYRTTQPTNQGERRSETPPVLPRPAPNADAVIHLTFPSSPASNPHTTSQLLNMLTFLARYTKPNSASPSPSPNPGSISGRPRGMSTYATYKPSPSSTPFGRPLKVLLYSLDGYTETSVLALSYLMHTIPCSLPEAYLELQVKRERSFFVCPGDLGVLRRIEANLGCADRSRKERESKREREKLLEATASRSVANNHDNSVVNGKTNSSNVVGSGSNSSSTSASGRWSKWPATWRTGSLSIAGPVATVIGAVVTGAVDTSSASSNSVTSRTMEPSPSASSTPPPKTATPRRARALTSPILPSSVDHQAWLSDPRFDGSFPSRVLPHLYLGNLNHASNVYMLHALGITHVVSVGECALVPPICPAPDSAPTPGSQFAFGGNSQFVYGSGPGGQGSLWIEEREGRIKVLDIKGVSDDGIDSLRPQFSPIVDWIDKAHAAGGKVLVHCRVGVSRSATVTIAYVMKHLNMDLVDAYLLVRSRRLSILIQPNMRLLYNLIGWEIQLAKERAARTGGPLVQGKRLSWPFLSREVHLLNERYLQ